MYIVYVCVFDRNSSSKVDQPISTNWTSHDVNEKTNSVKWVKCIKSIFKKGRKSQVFETSTPKTFYTLEN